MWIRNYYPFADQVFQQASFLEIRQNRFRLRMCEWGTAPLVQLFPVALPVRLLPASSFLVVQSTVLDLVTKCMRSLIVCTRSRVFGACNGCPLLCSLQNTSRAISTVPSDHNFEMSLLINMTERQQRVSFELRGSVAALVGFVELLDPTHFRSPLSRLRWSRREGFSRCRKALASYHARPSGYRILLVEQSELHR